MLASLSPYPSSLGTRPHAILTLLRQLIPPCSAFQDKDPPSSSILGENTRRLVQYNPAAPCIASTTRLLVQRTSLVRNLTRGALDVDRWLARERKERGGCGILELRLGLGRASSGGERQPLVWLGKRGGIWRSRETCRPTC